MDLAKDQAAFKNPPAAHRPAPFWFWNDHLDPDRLVWQFDRMTEAGTGGAVLHARGGLGTDEYLDERWFRGVEAVVKRAAETGKVVWIYDETGWPSGSAGGRVLRKNPEYGCRHLVMTDVVLREGGGLPELSGDLVGAFRVTRTDPYHGSHRRTDRGTPLRECVTLAPDRIECEWIDTGGKSFSPVGWTGSRLLLFHHVLHGGSIDYFNPKATESFIRFTHEEYYRRFGEHFGTTITHSFMDEAGTMSGASSLPWTDGFADRFRERRGYDLVPDLPKLFFEVPGYETVRFDYWSLVAELFREGFGMVLDRWCAAHRIHYSGHYVFETPLKEATRQLGSTMPLYEYQGMPGIDVLGNDFYTLRKDPEAYGFYLVMIKQAASVVNQLGKPGLVSESHGVGGHAMLPEDMQAVDNFQMALGVTHVTQHAPFYSLRGRRKLDHPPVIGWQQPYWKFVRKHMDAAGRIGWLLSQGKRKTDVLLIHPQSSMQATYRQHRAREEYKVESYIFDADMPFELIDKHITLLSTALLDAQIDFEYGDEEIMARHGSAEGDRLRIGEAVYRLVVLPPVVNIRSSTLRLLGQFAASGGRILLVGSAPYLVDGRPSDEATVFLGEHAEHIGTGVECCDYRRVILRLTAHGGRAVTIRTEHGDDAPAMKVHRRIWGDREVIYLANVSREPVCASVSFRPEVTGTLEEWDIATGDASPLAACVAGRELELRLDWAPKQARAFVGVPVEREIAAPVTFAERKRLKPQWTGKRTAPNILLLDECRVRDLNAPDRRCSISEARLVLAKMIEAKGGPARLRAKFPFTVSEANPPVGEHALACEFGGRPRVSLDGKALSLRKLGWLIDPANERIAFPPLGPGDHTLLVAGTYAASTDLESPWLVGEFDVWSDDEVTFRLERASESIPVGSWPKVGLPFYAGTVTYRAEVDLSDVPPGSRVVIEMPGLRGSAEVRMNGRVADQVLWPPYECDISELVDRGRNAVEIEVANTLRNLLGSHFLLDEDWRTGVAIRSYAGTVGQPKIFRDYGLLEAPEVVISAPR